MNKNILYYSTHCQFSKQLLQKIHQYNSQKLYEQLYFVCIDKRVRMNDKIFVILDNGNQIPLPPNITSVPALQLVHSGGRILLGDDIDAFLFPKQNKDLIKQKYGNNDGPQPFSLGGGGFVVSDQYSFLSQKPEEFMSKASGAKQLHHYATIDYNNVIETPPEDYTPDKVGEVSLEKLREQRNSEIPKPIERI